MKGKTFVNFMGYIATGLIAVALILSKILGVLDVGARIVSVMIDVSRIIAYAFTAVFAFNYAKSKKNIGWMIAYIVFVVAIIVFFVLGY